MKRFFTIAAAIITFTALTGCGTLGRFPAGASYDKHEFLSTPSQPLSVYLIDTFSGETIWSLDIPVGKKGVVDLGTGSDMLFGNKLVHATEIRWGILEPSQGTFYNFMPEKQTLSGNPVRLKLVVRDPEPYPDVTIADNATPATYVPTQAPAPTPNSATTTAPSPTANSATAPAPAPAAPAPPTRNFRGLRANNK